MLYTNLLNTNAIEVNDMTIGIEFPNGITPFGKAVLEKPENKTEISNQISIACGKTMQINILKLFHNSFPQVNTLYFNKKRQNPLIHKKYY